MSISLFLTCRVSWQAYLRRDGHFGLLLLPFVRKLLPLRDEFVVKRGNSSISDGVIPHRDVMGRDGMG
jgi:hypothetical protein